MRSLLRILDQPVADAVGNRIAHLASREAMIASRQELDVHVVVGERARKQRLELRASIDVLGSAAGEQERQLHPARQQLIDLAGHACARAITSYAGQDKPGAAGLAVPAPGPG